MQRRRVPGIRVPLCERHRLLIRENRLEAADLALVMQKDHGHHAHRTLARVALRHLALQVLQKTVREMIKRTLAPGIFLVARTAVGTDKFNFVLLRIAVQSGPTGAAYTNYLNKLP